jgi:alpha-galactosidase
MSSDLTRREILKAALASPIIAAVSQLDQAQTQSAIPVQFARAPGRIVLVDGSTAKQVEVLRRWQGSVCSSRLVNHGQHPVRIKEVVLFEIPLTLPRETRLYGEGFQMLSQTGGTLGEFINYSQYTDTQHYKLPEPAGAKVFYGMMTLSPPTGNHQLFAFTSCRRFAGQFYLRPGSVAVVVDAEGLELRPGESWRLEDFTFRSGPVREQLLDTLAKLLAVNHPPILGPRPPTGWCSWYTFGPRVTAQQVLDNLDFIAKNVPQLKYIQIDDGYQPAMGDWLETGAAFGGDVQGVLKQIRARGFEPAIWVAPFVAEEKSHLFTQHPDWFISDAEGKPLRSDRVTFGGWRRGPWYALDGTHPEAQKHLESVFRTMRTEWGCTYFKLDANFWGAMHGGRFHDRRATRVEAYRRGMQAIRRGAGNSFILGCNHPLWPSLGLIHGSRSSNDIKRSWDRIKQTARQNLSRNWQNGRLWWNDPDAVCLIGDLPGMEFRFHATAIYAAGGMILSGDDLTKISPERLLILRKLLPPTGAAAKFEDDSLSIGTVPLPDGQMFCVFNWEEEPRTFRLKLPRLGHLADYWTGEKFGNREGWFNTYEIDGRSATLLKFREGARFD